VAAAADASESAMARDDGSFDEFDARMRRLRGEPVAEHDLKAQRPSLGGTGLQVGIEMIAGVVGGGLIGYGLDYWLGTWPLLFIVFFFLGAAAGMLNAYRHIRRASEWPERGADRG
jgi:ATP synthase protein I